MSKRLQNSTVDSSVIVFARVYAIRRARVTHRESNVHMNRQVQTFELKCRVPIAFSFELVPLDLVEADAFEIEPTKGVIPANVSSHVVPTLPAEIHLSC